MPGRKREPAKVIRMKGKSHFTKAYLAEKEASEIHVEPKFVMPEGLNEEQRELYTETFNNLAEYGMATHMEADLLTRFVKAKYEYDRMTTALESNPVDDQYFKLLSLRLRVSEELRKCEGDLGLNVFARMKMSIPKQETKEPTQAEELFGEL